VTAHAFIVDALLALIVLTCWLGVFGMWRMKEPTQALHYLAIPATAGSLALTIAMFVEEGLSSAPFKMLFITVILLAINSVVTHATARAFRVRELGHWEPRDGDPIDFAHTQRHQRNQERRS
jgi:multisubunit Na+/H+ antiporter MnhG subunit